MSKWFLDLLLSNGSASVHKKNASVSKKMFVNVRVQWNAGTACVSECVLKTPACRGLRVSPSKSLTEVEAFLRSET